MIITIIITLTFAFINETSSYVITSSKITPKQLLLNKPYIDPILIDPSSSSNPSPPPLAITTQGYINTDVGTVNTILGCEQGAEQTTDRCFVGTTNTYLDLVDAKSTPIPTSSTPRTFITPPIPKPPPLPRWLSSALMLPEEPSTSTSKPEEEEEDVYIPMRDLFTSPLVSFAYERGWRSSFSAAGFPGPEDEYGKAKEFFVADGGDTEVVVDMSCGTGMFTRKFGFDEDRYISRLLACDYSDSMLKETRRRYDIELKRDKRRGGGGRGDYPRVELVRVDVGNLPFRSSSISCLHAGAAMHCWPSVKCGLSEIYRSLKPGGRYFATTFLAGYFRTVAGTREGDITKQNFQLFESAEVLRDMVKSAGFEDVEVTVEGTSCAIIRAKKGMGEGNGETEVAGETETQENDEVNASYTTPSSLSPPNPPPFQ